MEGRSGQENPLQFMSLNLGGNASDIFYGSGDDQNQLFVMSAGINEIQPDTMSLSQWIQCSKTPHSYVEFLTENSTFLEKAPTADVLESNALPVGGTNSVDGVSEIQRELLYNNSIKAFGSKPDDSSLHMDVWELKPSACTLNSNNHEASVSFLKPQTEGGSFNKSAYSQFQTYTQQNQTFGTQEPSEDNCNDFQFHPKPRVAASGFLSKPHHSVSRQKATVTDRQRRMRIADKLKALQELLPNFVEGSQASTLDDIISHIKFMQLQLKELSRSRLGGESTSHPFIFLEGYGHYVLHEQMMNEPLEEMMGNLLEINPSAATQLLESRGLYVMPMALVEGFFQATEII